MNFGIAGEFRIVVTDSEKRIKKDTGFQKNLILDQGLDFFGGVSSGGFNSYCVIGSGNSEPEVTQTALDAVVAITSIVSRSSSKSYTNEGDNLYKINETARYTFTGLKNVNVSELGLVSAGSLSSYYLNTRALVRDSTGAPTVITVLDGETLDIYYKVHKVVDITDKSYVVNFNDSTGNTEPYNVLIRPALVGLTNQWEEYWSVAGVASTNMVPAWVYTGDIGAFNSEPSVGSDRSSDATTAISTYVRKSNKIKLNVSIPLRNFNLSIRTFYIKSTFFRFQARFGSVADDSPIVKTNKDKLDLAFEFSWGRYEGVL